MKRTTKRSIRRKEGAKQRRKEFYRKLKHYSSAAGLGAFVCSSTAQGNIVYYDIPDVSITNTVGQTATAFIDIHADGPDNPDGSPPEWQIAAPAVSHQIRIDTRMTLGAPGDERADHSDIGNAPAGHTVLPGEGNQLLSLFGNPGSFNETDPNPGYYTESMPAGHSISRATLSPSFYVGLAMRFGNYPPPAYNNVRTGRYIGLEWAFNGPDSTDRIYGWAQVDVTNDLEGDFGTATLTGYAFEMTPNTPILAGQIPEPSSLALLAAGGGGLALAARRRRRGR